MTSFRILLEKYRKTTYFHGQKRLANFDLFQIKITKKGLLIRSKSELAFRIKSDLRSDQNMIVRSNFDLFNQDRHHYDFLSFEEVLER